MTTGASHFVLGYIQRRSREATLAARVDELTALVDELRARLAQREDADKRAAELERELGLLRSENEQLRARVRELEIGFRRFVPEHVAPEQLALAMKPRESDASPSPSAPEPAATGAEASAISAPSDAPASPALAATAASPPDPGDPGPKPPRQRNHHKHGRRRVAFIPKLILEVVPPEVQRQGIDNFERIGQEDSSALGRRRGGLIEVITRRVKFVRRVPGRRAAAATADAAPTPPDARPPTPSVGEELVVVQHEVAALPADLACKSNPFVDGAIVCYAPPSADEPLAGRVLIAPVPQRPIARGLVDASLLAHLFVHKFDYHTPYYRQEIEAGRQGCPLSRANMTAWQFDAGGMLKLVADAAWRDALEHRSWFGTDATGTAIQGQDAYQYGHIFVLVAPGDAVLFRYSETYDHAAVQDLFGGYTGTIVADASANHNVLFGPGKAREGGCWSHARKPFVKAFKAGEKAESAFAIKTIQALFRIEKTLASLSPEGRLEVRQRESAPLVDALFARVDEQLPTAPDESLTRKGLVYLRNQREPLQEFLRNGEIPLHNNACERELRRVVKGRKNWLSHGSAEHARRACAIYSLIASCKVHGIDPEFYLQEVLTVAPSWPAHAVLELAPKDWIATRQRLIAEGRLRYIDLAQISGSRLRFRPAA